MSLVTVEQVRAHCRAYPQDDAMLAIYSGAAEAQAIEFLNRRVFADQESLDAAVEAGVAGDQPMVVNDAVRAAILLQAGHLFENRENVVTGAVAELPSGTTFFLWPYRVGLGV